MGTSNFYNKNASRIFSFGLRDERVDDDSFDEYIYDDTRNNIRHELVSICMKKGIDISQNNEWEHNYNRNFPGKNLCEITKRHPKYRNVGISISIMCISRSGYYEGANMDWSINSVCVGQDDRDYLPDQDEIAWALECEDWSKGMAKIHAPYILKWIENTKDELVKLIEGVYEQFTDPLIRVATFSNGETIYKRVNEKEHGDVSVV